ncbi:MAG: class I SAM-dependent methyltransferase [Candidatus Vogelbacteria bacterium]|nr:class I SAM-dependent methyltransferase [Candidatus Vogelbacteria bacterium]
MTQQNNTSWGEVSEWYNGVIQSEDSYQRQVILPHLERLIKIEKNDALLDLMCGSGFFAHEFALKGTDVSGADISPELIAIAKRHAHRNEKYVVAPSDNITFADKSFDKIIIVLALQNIQNIDGTILECQRVMKQNGTLHIVLNHPAFRIPEHSSWEFDEKAQTQFRAIDKYMSETHSLIRMHPGARMTEVTISFHRPLQMYVKTLRKFDFAITGLEEWISHKKSDSGPRASAENSARKEFPLFMYLEARKIS